MNELVIEKPVLKNNRLISKIKPSKSYKKYFKKEELFIEYDTEITQEPSILNIPIIARVLPLAWLSGTNIHVKELDKRFTESMYKLRDTFAKMYPHGAFNSEIIVEELVENKTQPKKMESKTGILYSGGVDSSYSLIRNLKLNPRLIMIWGIDDFPYPEHPDHWNQTIEIYSKYAKKKNLEFNVIKTDINSVLNTRIIQHQYHKELYDGSLRASISHSMVTLPLAAPLSINRFDNLIIAASYSDDFDFSVHPRAAIPEADEKIVWADLNVKHHGYRTRMEKMEAIRESLTDDLTLRVCLRSGYVDGEINDSACEKCLRTIVFLILMGVDPNKCGFRITDSTFKDMKTMWENMKSSASNHSWVEIQSLIPNELDYDILGSKEFLEWFRDFDIKTTEKNWFYTDVYMNLPYSVASILDSLYRIIGINVHDYPYIRK